MPVRLRPTAPTAAEAILVGDPGRALLLAQELLEEPKMSNHARGLWGYFGQAPAGTGLTIQSTGMGGPSAALVLTDLAELGVRRIVRVGTCVGLDDRSDPGDLVLVSQAIAEGGSATAVGIAAGATVAPDRELTEKLRAELGDSVRATAIASLDAHPGEMSPRPGLAAADMQTAPLFARAQSLAIGAAALLIVTESVASGESLDRDALETVEKLAGRAAAAAFSS
jgi:uridine phosphorylase